MKPSTRSLLVAVAGLVAAAGAVLLASPGRAIDEVNDKPAPLGLVGMTQDQTLRLSVAYVKGFDPQPDPPGCRIRVGFVRADNSVIGTPVDFDLRPGTARSFDLAASAIGDPGIRVYARPVAVDLAPRERCPAVISGELVDREGINGIIVYDSVAFTDPWLSK
jgi:hypothetical protein